VDGLEGDGGGEERRVEVGVAEGEGVRKEDGVGDAVQAGEVVGAEVLRGGLVVGRTGDLETYVDGTGEVGASGEDVGEEQAEENGEDPCAKETFQCFLRA